MTGETKYNNNKKQTNSFWQEIKKQIPIQENNLNMFFKNKLQIKNAKIFPFYTRILCFKFKDSRKKEDKLWWIILFRWNKLSKRFKGSIFQKGLNNIRARNRQRKIKNKKKEAKNIKSKKEKEEDQEVKVHQILISLKDQTKENVQENIKENMIRLKVLKKHKLIQKNQNSLNYTNST